LARETDPVKRQTIERPLGEEQARLARPMADKANAQNGP
jgi:hypothetical protein